MREPEDGSLQKPDPIFLVLKMADGRWKMGSMSEVLWWPLEAEKDKETNSSLEPLEGVWPR